MLKNPNSTLYLVSGNTVTTERILRQCQVRDPLTLLNFQPSNSKVGDLILNIFRSKKLNTSSKGKKNW